MLAFFIALKSALSDDALILNNLDLWKLKSSARPPGPPCNGDYDFLVQDKVLIGKSANQWMRTYAPLICRMHLRIQTI